ncbi:phage tail protein [Streptomyces sp. MS2.AVA.5]|uniref:Phage tail protein n=1 Tax=Streptomyces achmelvichensis TaxID=3134111 RepID=A0ACC6PL84_9ACTN
MSADAQALSAHHFSLKIDGRSLGLFTQCTGLALAVEVDVVTDGGFNDAPVYLPTRITYPPLVVSRPVSRESPKWCRWVQETVRQRRPLTGEITCMGVGNERVATWELLDVMPVAWRGPALDARGGGVAMEEIEFVHGGFLPQAGSPGRPASA